MNPGAELFAAGPAPAPSLLWAALRVAGMLALLGLGAWLLVKRRGLQRGIRSIEVLDRAFLSRGASVALLRAGSRRLLLGITAEQVRLLCELDGQAAPEGRADFAGALERAGGGRGSGT
jgi:flagellar biogenesis protein FliO